jgi:hypothetical protein
MSSPRTGLRIAATIFAIFALGHLLRLVTHARVVVGTHQIPMVVSVFGLVIGAGLSVWMWTVSLRV